MKTEIGRQLSLIEEQENCRVLLAVESGSRAWGFPSPDSDYDVRFLYVRPREHYLRLDRGRDVIELPISDLLDINGWDADKTLRLLHKSNPTLFEWLSSPIVYRSTPFADTLRAIMGEYFLQKSGLWHYLHMAEGNYREYLRGDTVRAKKYFYVLRPILACRWILERGTPPPMVFSDLADACLIPELKHTVDDLLELKIHAPEIKLIPRIDPLNRYLENSILEIRQKIEGLPAESLRDWTGLNRLFLDLLECETR